MPDSCPTWDLTDLYEGIGDDAIAANLARCRCEAERMESAWQDKIDNATPQDLATLIADYEKGLEALGKAQSHAQLLFAASTTDPQIARHHQSIREASADIGARLLFVELEIAALPHDHVAWRSETAEFAVWQPWLRRRETAS